MEGLLFNVFSFKSSRVDGAPHAPSATVSGWRWRCNGSSVAPKINKAGEKDINMLRLSGDCQLHSSPPLYPHAAYLLPAHGTALRPSCNSTTQPDSRGYVDQQQKCGCAGISRHTILFSQGSINNLDSSLLRIQGHAAPISGLSNAHADDKDLPPKYSYPARQTSSAETILLTLALRSGETSTTCSCASLLYDSATTFSHQLQFMPNSWTLFGGAQVMIELC